MLLPPVGTFRPRREHTAAKATAKVIAEKEHTHTHTHKRTHGATPRQGSQTTTAHHGRGHGGVRQKKAPARAGEYDNKAPARAGKIRTQPTGLGEYDEQPGGRRLRDFRCVMQHLGGVEMPHPRTHAARGETLNRQLLGKLQHNESRQQGRFNATSQRRATLKPA